MRWVDRGPEPGGVAGYAQQFTQGWIDYFQNGVGGRPTDFYWSRFRTTLGSRTNNICWYCERQCERGPEVGGQSPTVDHFRPISRCPRLAYVWSNWIFSCRRCNGEYKKDQWPEMGYVDPCADNVMERPEQYFDYDADTGEIIPKDGLTDSARQKTLHTINGLGLNRWDLLLFRVDQTRGFIEDLFKFPVPERQAFIEWFTGEGVEYAGTIGMVVEQLRRDGYI